MFRIRAHLAFNPRESSYYRLFKLKIKTITDKKTKVWCSSLQRPIVHIHAVQ